MEYRRLVTFSSESIGEIIAPSWGEGCPNVAVENLPLRQENYLGLES
jgi:hypothetical protein